MRAKITKGKTIVVNKHKLVLNNLSLKKDSERLEWVDTGIRLTRQDEIQRERGSEMERERVCTILSA